MVWYVCFFGEEECWTILTIQSNFRQDRVILFAVGHQVAIVYCWRISLVAFPRQEWIQCYIMPLNSFWRKMNRCTRILHFKGYFEETYCWQLSKPIAETSHAQTILQEYSSSNPALEWNGPNFCIQIKRCKTCICRRLYKSMVEPPPLPWTESQICLWRIPLQKWNWIGCWFRWLKKHPYSFTRRVF